MKYFYRKEGIEGFSLLVLNDNYSSFPAHVLCTPCFVDGFSNDEPSSVLQKSYAKANVYEPGVEELMKYHHRAIKGDEGCEDYKIGERFYFWDRDIPMEQLGFENDHEWLALADYVDNQIASGAPGFCVDNQDNVV